MTDKGRQTSLTIKYQLLYCARRRLGYNSKTAARLRPTEKECPASVPASPHTMESALGARDYARNYNNPEENKSLRE